MVKICENLLKRSSSKKFIPVGDGEEGQKRFLRQITHLYLQEKNIQEIENLDSCENLLALYLYDNKINKIQNLDHLKNLRFLYLYENNIEKIENLHCLRNLTCLKLGRNKISLVGGLRTLTKLEQLWVENQRLPKGVSLEFERESMSTISRTLRVLNVSGNSLKSLFDLTVLQFLETLYAENNKLESLQELVNSVVHWKHLREMKLDGNAVCKVRKFRDNVVVYCPQLKVLDRFVVPLTYRTSMEKWKEIINGSPTNQQAKTSERCPFLRAQVESPTWHPIPGTSSAPELRMVADEERFESQPQSKSVEHM